MYRRRLALAFALLAVIALSLLALPALAFNPSEESARWEISRLGAPSQVTWETYSLDEATSLAAPGVAAFADHYGGRWYYQVNHLTNTYHHVYGSGIDLGATLKTNQEVEALARSFIQANPMLFSVGSEDLSVTSCTNALSKWSIIFQQTYKGLRVWGGRVYLVFTEQGRLFALGSDAYPGIDISVAPVVTEPSALAIAEDDIGYRAASDKVTYSEMMVLPVETGEAGLEYRLAYRFDLKVEEPLGIWATWVDARQGDILWRENHIRFTNFTGHSQGDVEWDGYCDGSTADYPLKNMQVTITGVGTANTNANGDFTLTYGGTDSRAISAEFLGPWVNVNKASGTDASHAGTITPGTPYTIDWSNTNSLASERDAFTYTNKIHDWVKSVDPAFTGLDYRMIAVIEGTTGYCPGNAWWDGTNINFCAQSTSYGNTARMADVVYHEYTHGITDALYGFNPVGDDVHEGNSDVGANFLTRESIMGLGFYLNNCTTGIRNSLNSLQDPCSDEAHICGQVLAGFYWDSWQALLGAYPQAVADSVARSTWHFARKLGLPETMADQAHWTFVADDNDGNLTNGTPHYNQFCVGATNHGFPCPEITVGVSITHTPLPNTLNTSTPYAVTSVITSTAGAIDVGACHVTYRANGGAFTNVSISATGNPNEYVGYIPAQQACTKIEYYIYARDMVGNTKTHPATAPASLNAFLVGYPTAFADDFETNKGWTAGVTGDNAITGVWERCDPQGTTAQAEDDHTPAPGVNAYITQCAAGSGQGSYDVDGGKTTLLSPIFNLTGYTQATVSYYRWYSNDTGAEPGTDYWVVDVTADGTNWVHVENTNVSNRTWKLMQFNIGAYVSLTSQVRFRFIASDYDPGSLVEAGVDDFSIVGCSQPTDTEAPVVTVLDPNGGETIMGGGGSTHTVRWHASDNVGVTNTRIILSKDGGATYPDTLVSGALDSTWVWTVPDVDESACRIKVVARDAAGNAGNDLSDGTFEIVSVAGVPGGGPVPEDLVLLQNSPSPFKRVTEIEFGLPSDERISLKVYAVDGRLVATLADRVFPAGYHKVLWHGTDSEGVTVSTGVYFYRLETGGRALTRKLLMVK